MKSWKFNSQVALSILLGSVIFVAIDFFMGELLIRSYMGKYGITKRLDLSDDMGFGLLAIAAFLLSLIVVLPVAQYISWRILKSTNWFKR